MEDALRPVVVQCKPEAKDIFAFKMYHSFWSFLGFIRLLVSAGFLITAVLSIGRFEALLTIALFAFGLLNPFVTPILFWVQAISAAKQCIPTTYTFTEEKISLSDGKKRADLRWENLALIVWLKKELFLYTTPTQALILPKRQMNACEEELKEIICASGLKNRTVIRDWL